MAAVNEAGEEHGTAKRKIAALSFVTADLNYLAPLSQTADLYL